MGWSKIEEDEKHENDKILDDADRIKKVFMITFCF